jgi:hypothetical protein
VSDEISNRIDSEMTEAMPDGLFVFNGTTYLPSEFTRGPWRADAQHGGPPSGLLAHVCEPLVHEGEFLSHLDIELLRPVPLTPLTPHVSRRQVSGRVARIDAELASEHEIVARATALVLATTELSTPDWTTDLEPATSPPPPEATVDPPRWASGDVTTYHRNAVEHRFTEGSFREPGPAVDWVRLRLPLVAGEETSGLERLSAAADFGSGISAIYGADATVGLINANLAVALYRPLVGEWVSLDATTHVGPQGTGLGITMLGDTEGLVGVASQSLLGYSMRR